MTIQATRSEVGSRTPTTRRYLMCRPTYFDVLYEINPWMHVDVAVDRHRALAQWEALRATYLETRSSSRRPGAVCPGCPTWSSRPTAPSWWTAPLGAQFKHEQRAAEAARRSTSGWRTAGVIAPSETNEGEGDLPAGGAGAILAGHGFRTDAAGARRGAGAARPPGGLAAPGRPALLPPGHGARRDRRREHRLLPGGLLGGQSRVLSQLFPDAVIADDEDALAFGLNLVSDGANVVLNSEATRLAGSSRRPATPRSRWSWPS